MGARVGLTILLIALVAIMACEDDTVSPPPKEKPSWWLEPDSMNLGILVLDYLTYEFIGGRVDHYALCDTCDRDSLPFEVIYNFPLDFGDITFRYTETGDTILYATTVWNGWGQIEYPGEFLPIRDFEWLPWRFAPPISIEYFNNEGKTTGWARADTAWSRAASMDVAAEFAKLDYRVGIYAYGAASAPAIPELNRWVLFLYRGRDER
jgi:hypothetical protein